MQKSEIKEECFGGERVILFPFQVAPEIIIVVTKIMGFSRPVFFADYYVLRCLKYSTHELVSSMCRSISFLEIPMLSLFCSLD
jgi:hypothetical protein